MWYWLYLRSGSDAGSDINIEADVRNGTIEPAASPFTFEEFTFLSFLVIRMRNTREGAYGSWKTLLWGGRRGEDGEGRRNAKRFIWDRALRKGGEVWTMGEDYHCKKHTIGAKPGRLSAVMTARAKLPKKNIPILGDDFEGGN